MAHLNRGHHLHRGQKPSSGNGKSRAPVMDWNTPVTEFIENGDWDNRTLGPRPGRNGCRVPPEVLQRHAEGLEPNGVAIPPGPGVSVIELEPLAPGDSDGSCNGAESDTETGIPARLELNKNDVDLAEMNALYAVTKVGGKTRVMSLEDNPTFPGCKVPVFSTIQDFCAFHFKRKKEGRGEKQIGIGRWWIEHPERRQYDGVVYAPGLKNPSMFNLWRGFSCEPVEGDCDLYLAHLENNICSENVEHYRYLLDWMAYGVQHPDRQGEVAGVLRGNEGTGKGVAAKQYGYLFGSHFRHIVHAKHLVGHFNAHLQQCSVLFADEAFFAGDRAHESILKGLITEETLLIEPKGVDPFAVRNCIHLIMSSNADWVIPAGADARRFFVLNVSDACKQDRRYFASIVHQMENGGREALLFHLLKRDLSGFNVGAVPQTGALGMQKAYTRRGIDRLVEQIANDGRLPSVHTAHLDIALTTGEEDNKGFYANARTLVPDLKFLSSITIANKLKEWGCEPWKSGYQRGIKFPSLAELRARFDRKHGKQEWPTDPADWEGV